MNPAWPPSRTTTFPSRCKNPSARAGRPRRGKPPPNEFPTERKAAEERLQRSAALLRMAVELSDYAQMWGDEVCAIYEVPPGSVRPVAEAFDRP